MGKLSITTEQLDDRSHKLGDVAFISTPVATTLVGQTYKRLEGTWTDSFIEGFFVNAQFKLEYSGIDRSFLGAGTAAVEVNSPGIVVFLAVTKNGTVIPGSEGFNLCKTANEPYTLAGNWYTELTSGDVLEVVTKTDSGTNTVTATGLTVSWQKVY